MNEVLPMRLSEARLKRLLTTLWNTRYTGSFNSARLLAKQAVRLPNFDFDAESATVTSPLLKTRFGIEKHFQFLPELKNLEELVELGGAKLSAQDDGSLDVEIRGVRVKAYGPEQVAILRELFVGGIYNFHVPRKAVVLDIGMNMGIASLFFALSPNVEKVYSYEPFPETYKFATRNFLANPLLAAKISPNQSAVSDRNGDIEVEYSSTARNCNSVVYSQPSVTGHTTKQQIRLVDAAEVVGRIHSEHPEHALVAKVDCEGSEYAIFERLASEGLLKRFSAFMVEWHGQGPQKLESALVDAGFFIISHDASNKNVGMFYAAKLS